MNRQSYRPLMLAVTVMLALVPVPAFAASYTTQWTGNGVVSDAWGIKSLKNSTCALNSEPNIVFVLSGAAATAATITIDGVEDEMTKVQLGRNQSAWKFEYTSGQTIDLDGLQASGVSVTYVGKQRGILTAGSGCAGVPATWRSVAAGRYHTCAVTHSGAVKCWGANIWGQLGTGNNDDLNRPSAALNLGVGRTAVQVGAGNGHSCALLDDGTVKCWGSNEHGVIGVGDRVNRNAPSDAVAFATGRTAKAITTQGHYHTCALLDNNSISCWGANGAGQLGVGDTTDRLVPGPIVNLGAGRTAKAIVAGEMFTCALLDTDDVKCWGGNIRGELGIGGSQQTAPTSIVPLSGKVKAISAGEAFACALLMNNTVECWGTNNEGQLGIGDNDPGSAVAFPAGRTVKAITTGDYHACAILDNDSLICWGYNYSGGLGVGNTTDLAEPGPVVNLGLNRTAKFVDGGVLHTCAILDNDTMKCWGGNQVGELGIGTFEDLSAPGPIL